MCYRIVSHMMRCDVRPVLSNGHTRFVDGYAEPHTCSCPRSAKIKPWLRCDKHGCCRTAVKTHLCVDPDSCPGQVVFHRYYQVRCEIRNHMTKESWQDKTWDDLIVVDGRRFPVGGQAPRTRLQFECPLFRTTLEFLLHAGRGIVMLEDTIDRMVADSERLTALMEGHNAREQPEHKVNYELACMIMLTNGAIDRGRAEKHYLINRFGEIQDELETLASWGERAVIGLDEVPDWDMLSSSDGMIDEQPDVAMAASSGQKHLIMS